MCDLSGWGVWGVEGGYEDEEGGEGGRNVPMGLLLPLSAFYLHDIFLFSLIISVLWGGSAGSVSEAGPGLYRQVILPLSLTRLELFKCYFQDSGRGEGEKKEVGEKYTNTHAGVLFEINKNKYNIHVSFN